MTPGSDAVDRLRASYAFRGFGSVPTNRSVQVLSGTNIFAGTSYVYSGFEHVKSSRTRVAIDPNVRVRGNGTYSGFEDVDGPVSVGEDVQVYEPESGLTGTGRVTEIDRERELVYLSVDWSELACDDRPTVSASSPATYTQTMYLSPDSIVTASPEREWLQYAAVPSLASFSWHNNAFSVTASVPAAGFDLVSPFTTGPHIEMWQSTSLLKVVA